MTESNEEHNKRVLDGIEASYLEWGSSTVFGRIGEEHIEIKMSVTPDLEQPLKNLSEDKQEQISEILGKAASEIQELIYDEN